MVQGNFQMRLWRVVSDGYVGAMGIPAACRPRFVAADTPKTEPVIVVNETMARRLWPGQMQSAR